MVGEVHDSEMTILLRHTLFSNVILFGQSIPLEQIERLIAYAIEHGITSSLLLNQVGEHIEMSDWITTDMVRQTGQGTADVNGILNALCGEDLVFHESCDLRCLLSKAIDDTRPDLMYVSLPPRGSLPKQWQTRIL